MQELKLINIGLIRSVVMSTVSVVKSMLKLFCLLIHIYEVVCRDATDLDSFLLDVPLALGQQRHRAISRSPRLHAVIEIQSCQSLSAGEPRTRRIVEKNDMYCLI
jgi:hypothetical protein